LLQCVEKAGLSDVLKSELLTVFAPSDAAFAKVDAAALQSLLEDKDKLTEVLKTHILQGSVNSKKLAAKDKQAVDSLQGRALDVKVGKGDAGMSVAGAKIVQSDLKGANGVIHVIDTVIL
jgi:uncharacterized surface protein with fasciclin (FAS1) repeats